LGIIWGYRKGDIAVVLLGTFGDSRVRAGRDRVDDVTSLGIFGDTALARRLPVWRESGRQDGY
jgi:hypothetical protein